ncbi:hypothetical protein C0J27_04680 [Candidatus Chromulinivorax destructor]|uniref:Uncharacterized protein n=1 Tax=Candidatus Chromulinivorax destructor TaxID=2066483 RepID=A0A345ZCI2_9BACT|nr:hypothetical protein C0J27_04680 [Candidatus Chromulinivorax destructor]
MNNFIVCTCSTQNYKAKTADPIKRSAAKKGAMFKKIRLRKTYILYLFYHAYILLQMVEGVLYKLSMRTTYSSFFIVHKLFLEPYTILG